jgi:hypothetical protein
MGNTNWDADVVKANEWGLEKGADVTNMSWGTVCGETRLRQAPPSIR